MTAKLHYASEDATNIVYRRCLKLVVATLFRQQLCVTTLLNNVPVVHHNYPIKTCQSAQAMRHHDQRFSQANLL